MTSGSSPHANAPKQAAPASDVIRPSFSLWNLVPWAIAACFALAAAWLGQRYMVSQSEVAALRDQNALVDIAMKTAQQQLEAERIITRRQLQDAQQQLAGVNTQVEDARNVITQRDGQLVDARNQIAEHERQLTDAHRQLASRDQLVESLNQRIDRLTTLSGEANRQLTDARQQIARLTNEMKTQGDLANLKITALVSQLKNAPQALAVAVWDPRKQEGVFNVEHLPALAANEDYQLWVVDPQYPDPIDAGLVSVEPTSGRGRFQFKTKQPIGAVNAFAVTRERKGGVPKAQGPFVLLGK